MSEHISFEKMHIRNVQGRHVFAEKISAGSSTMTPQAWNEKNPKIVSMSEIPSGFLNDAIQIAESVTLADYVQRPTPQNTIDEIYQTPYILVPLR